MPAYLVGTVYDVNDPEGFQAYRNVALPTLEQYGGKFVGGGESVEVLDGDSAAPGFVVIEFESVEQAKRWYNSPEYQAVLPMRKNTTNSSLILSAGM
ncbi:MAG: hypothetical protein BZY88_17230 [SAR202 cluster bacterium Io17-Chloro-G9]|nr:MAG: hypothetical protein BZY88_17230 [SAR202 cluster bacterium Io17-Chloro-G9]